MFAEDAAERMAERVRMFPSLAAPRAEALDFLQAGPFEGAFVDYAERQMRWVCEAMGFGCRIVRSSSLDIDPALKAQDRILAILQALGSGDYLNAPGGRELYDAAAFAERGMSLRFLPDYAGPFWSLLHRLAVEDLETIRTEITSQT